MTLRVRQFLFGFAMLVFAAQGINRPAMTRAAVPRIDQSRNIPRSVQAVVKRACKDCHSAETAWPWYSRIAPVSWLLQRDVREGRKRLDFSRWASPDSKGPGLGEVEEICGATTTGDMPPTSYRFMHPDSKLTREDVAVFCQWADKVSAKSESSR